MKSNDSINHLMNNCSTVANSIYLTRHNETKIIAKRYDLIPWYSKQNEKYKSNQHKYIPIPQKLKFKNPGYEVDQITLVMVRLVAYSDNLNHNIPKVIFYKSSIKCPLQICRNL